MQHIGNTRLRQKQFTNEPDTRMHLVYNVRVLAAKNGKNPGEVSEMRETSNESTLAISRTQSSTLATIGSVADTLKPVLKRSKVALRDLRTALIGHFEDGMVVNIPLVPTKRITATALRRGQHVIGLIVTTVALLDPISYAVLKPGIYAVRLRPMPLSHSSEPEFAFDFLGVDGESQLSVRAFLNPGHHCITSRRRIAAFYVFDLVINTQDPRGANGCISFLEWSWCFGPRSDED